MIDFSKLNKLRSELNEAITNKDAKKLKSILNRESPYDTYTYINLNYIDKEGQSPLHRSCLIGSLDICKILVEFGASQGVRNNFGWYPIHLASYYGHGEVVKFLLNEDNFKKESVIDVFEDDDEKYRSSLKNSNPKPMYRQRAESNEESSEESEDDEDESDCDSDDDLFNLDLNSNVDDLIQNLNQNELTNLLDFQNLELNSNDFLF